MNKNMAEVRRVALLGQIHVRNVSIVLLLEDIAMIGLYVCSTYSSSA